MVDEGTKKTLSSIPLLQTKAGPRDKELWTTRLKEEYQALIKYVQNNKSADNDWFRLESDKTGTKWFGKCWYVHNLLKYEFDLEFDIPITYPTTAPELALPGLDGKTAKMYRGGKICLTDHFKPLWARNVPRFGIAHAMALGLGPWLAVEIPDLIEKAGLKKYENFMKQNYAPNFGYQDFAPMFTAEFFNADKWAKLFAESGARYIVLTSKHHEGFTLFPSKKSFNWNSVDVGPKMDVVGELSKAVRQHGLKFGVYHSLYEWYNPVYNEDKQSKFRNTTFIDTKLMPDLKQLVNDYNSSVIWADGDWEASDEYWKSKEFLSWLYSDSPVKDEVVVNDRWGKMKEKHGDFYDYADRFNNRTLQKHKWESTITLDKRSWGFRREMDIGDVTSSEELVENLVTAVSCGGNMLINLGPTREGTITPIFQERLLSFGKWLAINGEAIYGSSPWFSQNDTINGNAWYTCTKQTYNSMDPTAKPKDPDEVIAIYAAVLGRPADGIVRLKAITPFISSFARIELLGVNTTVQWSIDKGVSLFRVPSLEVIGHSIFTLKFSRKN